MPIACPKCNHQLPQVETLEYRFCPYCGVEIPAEPKKLDDTFQTIPPDLTAERQQKSKQDVDPEIREVDIGPSIQKTQEPKPRPKRDRPKINPPATPPPPSFLRTRPEEKDSTPIHDYREPAAKNRKRILIITLALIALLILLIGGYFTF
jgi:hypothetical protein